MDSDFRFQWNDSIGIVLDPTMLQVKRISKVSEVLGRKTRENWDNFKGAFCFDKQFVSN